MRVNFLIGVFVMALLQQQHHHMVNAYTMSETCQYYKEGFVGNPENCQGYGYCQDNAFLGNSTCPSGTNYDVYGAACLSSAKCSLSIIDQCAALTAPQYLGDPDNCQRYCYCENSKIAGCNLCPKGQIYADERCIWAPEDKPCGDQSICRLVPDYTVLGDPDNCGSYVICLKGESFSQTCTTGYFNVKTGVCQPTNPCTNTPSNPGTQEFSCADATDDSYNSDGVTCSGYYYCATTTDQGVFMTCPFGTHFNPEATNGPACVTPYTYSCPYDRCNNLYLSFVTAINTECHGYERCVNSQSTGEPGACPTSYPYFDEVTGICQKADPGYTICTAQ